MTPADGARVVVIAKPGPPGPEGPQGPAAPGGSGYLHTQTTPSAVWDVTHNLGQTVVQVAAVYNTDFTTQLWNVICEPLTADTCRLFFGDPVSGFALIHT
ncbi:hypothetical protein ACFYY5_29665 [Nocardia elegans]|uniref:Collagen-like protein n=1 Tax=Nocardia elegans TaxID=300029 RepID=A0ABW6TP90_9NOCA